MGLCKDKSIAYLKDLGYNVVRHPREGIEPLALVGRQNDTTSDLGSLTDIFVPPAPAAPAVETGLQAADINGKQSSKLDFGIGANLLGALIGAMGGKLEASAKYTNARTISFQYESVQSDRVDPTDVNQLLGEGQLALDSPLVNEYVLGNGNLYVITDVVKSTKFTVKYESSSGVEAKVEVPVIEQLVEGNVSVSATGEQSGTVTFEGKVPLVFGFRCLELGVLDGVLRLTLSKPGAVSLSAGQKVEKQEFAQLNGEHDGLLDLAA